MPTAWDPRSSGWTPNMELPEAKPEHFARLRSRGASIAAAAREAGVSRATGQAWSNGDSALQVAVQDRVRFLKATAVRSIPSAVELYHEMIQLAGEARVAGQFKAAGELYWKLYEEQRDSRMTPLEAHGETTSLKLVSGGEDDPALLLREDDDE